MASKPGTDGGGNVHPDTGEPVETTPDVDGKPDAPGQQTPGDEPFPPPPGTPSPDAGAQLSEGNGHPLPASEEARHDQIPESLEARKGEGDDAKEASMPSPIAVNPDGEPYDRG